MNMNKMKRGVLALLSSVAAAFVVSVSVAPAIAVSAEKAPEVAVIGTSTGVGEGFCVSDYKVAIEIGEDSSIDVKETIRVQFTADGLTEFYRSIPRSVNEVTAISVTCDGNEALKYSIIAAENSTTVACYGGTELGNEWTYVLDYTLGAESVAIGEELVINIASDTLGYVEAEISLPEAIVSYDAYGEGALSTNLSLDGKTLTLSETDRQSVAAGAITVKISLPDQEIIDDAKDVMESSVVQMWLPMISYALITIIITACVVLMIVF